MGIPYVDARAFGNLGRVYLTLATSQRRGGTSLPPSALAKKAAVNLEKSRALWTEAKVAAGHESRRLATLASLQRDLETAQKLSE